MKSPLSQNVCVWDFGVYLEALTATGVGVGDGSVGGFAGAAGGRGGCAAPAEAL